MGTLAHFNLPGIIERYGLKHFVETGTGTGDSLALAAMAPFETLHSIEIVPVLASSAAARFAADKRIRVHRGESAEVLPEILAAIPPGDGIFFWLDAHFAGADYGLAKYDDEKDVGRRLPLERELQAILAARDDVSRDVLIMDDARVYQPGPYAAGDLPADFPGLQGVKRSMEFIRKGLSETHGVVVDFAGTGFVMCCPSMTYEQVNA
jgi:hypothetical protein